MNIKDQLQAGDTIGWTETLSEYPASDGWTLKYRLSGKSQIDITATADGDGYSISVAATTSAAWQAGTYAWQAYVIKSTDVHTVATGSVEILQSLRTLTGTHDGRTYYQRCLEAVQAALERRASRQEEEQTLPGGKSVRHLSPKALLETERKLKLLVAQEKKAELLKQGKRVTNSFKFRFNRPR